MNIQKKGSVEVLESVDPKQKECRYVRYVGTMYTKETSCNYSTGSTGTYLGYYNRCHTVLARGAQGTATVTF